MKFSDAVADYLNHIRFERGLAKTTCLHYQCWLRHFSDWLAEHGYGNDLEAVFTTGILRQYQYSKAKSDLKARTIHSAFYPLRGLGQFLVAARVLDANPTQTLQLPKKGAAERLLVTDAEVAALLDACERQRTPRQIALCRAVLCLLAFGALRRDELCSLLLSDLDLADGGLTIRHGKGDKRRTIFLCQQAIDALREWVRVREKDSASAYLLTIDRRRRMHHEGIATLMETVKATAGLRENRAIVPHALRHWCASNMLKNGASMADVSLFLGHSDIQTTCRYLHSSQERLRSIRELASLQLPPKPQEAPVHAVVRMRDDTRREAGRRRRIAR